MFAIESITIEGFRGRTKPLVISLNDDVNFFIGRNGTGKTTLMKLLSAALGVDIPGLCSVEFNAIVFKLRRARDRRRPSITIARDVDDDGDPRFRYEIAQSSRGKPKKYILHTTTYSRSSSFNHFYPSFISRPQAIGEFNRPVSAEISKLLNFSWISVNRGDAPNGPGSNVVINAEGMQQLPVDRKLQQVANDFVTYFSTLDKKAAEETDKFQQVYLLALISPSGFEHIRSIKTVDIEEEKSAIRGMFAEFNIKASSYNQKLEAFIKRMARAAASYSPGAGLDADDFLVLTDMVRIHDSVKEWHKLLDERTRIYKPKSDFVEIVNELFFKKTLTINRGNQPVFTGEGDKPLKLDELSSGEKQLFILLGETLLQRRESCVFMADEPELSLHIDWQTRLVPSLRRINPAAQIVFATHSPDVVGAYSQAAIDLEKIV